MSDPNKVNNGYGYHLSDLYPGMSFQETSTDVNPESEDQMALVDDQATAEQLGGDPASKFSIFTAVAVLIAVAIILGVAD